MKYLNEVRLRWARASKGQFLLESVNAVSICYAIYYATRFTVQKALPFSPSTTELALFIFAALFTNLHRYYLTRLFRPHKWEHEFERRKRTLAVALTKFAKCYANHNTFSDKDWNELERAALETIRSYVEEILIDVEGTYFNVSLLIENPANPDQLVCINRVRTDRPIGRTYNKQIMVVWKAMQTCRLTYSDEFESYDSDVPYRSILAIPVTDAANDKKAIGAVSIDSSVPNHFTGKIVARINVGILPYIAMVRLVLLSRQALSGGDQ